MAINNKSGPTIMKTKSFNSTRLKPRDRKIENNGRLARSVLECGGKRSATPLSDDKDVQYLSATLRPKAVSPLRSATAVQKLARIGIALICFFILHSSFCLRASGQSYSIDWHKIAGGGGTSTGGVYAVTGTIGQHDAGGPITGGNYSLTGGFWSLISVVQTAGAPTLHLRHAGNVITVYWQDTTGWSLVQNGDLTTPIASWPASSGVTATNGVDYLIVTPPTGNLFFRLSNSPPP
jgi:hypothetical protein